MRKSGNWKQELDTKQSGQLGIGESNYRSELPWMSFLNALVNECKVFQHFKSPRLNRNIYANDCKVVLNIKKTDLYLGYSKKETIDCTNEAEYKIVVQKTSLKPPKLHRWRMVLGDSGKIHTANQHLH